MSQVRLGLRGNSLITFGIPSMAKNGCEVINLKPRQFPVSNLYKLCANAVVHALDSYMYT